ncbi:hypothetical protein BGZ95_008981 [Linnemannia exigua]|uniref:Uncharacterized protein n=1 Tax=Linnemannia exigua TaxID=604196 RepID=A0AAD4HAF4_9FUNG|nr:hypothetical protein BGZ95_008981 [Linnemannia exigua]
MRPLLLKYPRSLTRKGSPLQAYDYNRNIGWVEPNEEGLGTTRGMPGLLPAIAGNGGTLAPCITS